MTLERIEHKVFASEAPLDEMGQFGSALATTKLNTKDVAEIQALPAYTQGWGSAIISENNYPAMEEMNGVLNVMSYHTGYLYQEGVPVYSPTQTYSATSWVKTITGEKIYRSKQGENKGNDLEDSAWWEELKLGGGTGLQMFDTILKDHVLTYEETKGLSLQGTYVYKDALVGSRYGYPDFYAKCLEERNTAIATQVTLGDSTITMYVASNGHQYYDIANKDVVDTFFDSMGTAWFYGVDTENERIFLPRETKKRFLVEKIEPTSTNPYWRNLYSDGWCEQGSKATADWGDTVTVTLPKPYLDTSFSLIANFCHQRNTDDNLMPSIASNSQIKLYVSTAGANSDNWTGLACWETRGYAEKPQISDSFDDYLYICVGNTTNYEGVSEVVNQGMDILEQVNEGIESRVAKEDMVELPIMTMPDYSLIITGVSTPYTAPCNGFLLWNNAAEANCSVNGVFVPLGGNDSYNEGPAMLPLSKGDVITFNKDAGTACFVPMKGAN